MKGRHPSRIAALSAALAVGLAVLIGSAGPAAAATYALHASVWGAWTQYSQQESNWCWAAATKSMIQKKTGNSPDECTIAHNGLQQRPYATCANSGGTAANIEYAMSASGLSYKYFGSVPSMTTIRNETVAGRGIIGSIFWASGGGHAMPLIGSNTSDQIYVTKIDTTSVSGTWISYSSFTSDTGGWPALYTPSWAVGYN
ncbi:papain-like cysteine protease family protein [Xylanimonas sp. McL0601]|uniref:papain-like cysteine protease family protein n=1 Tax=Xylanimonas sp. McL0601 TaxID=3414739 RepID=UPI003CF0D471